MPQLRKKKTSADLGRTTGSRGIAHTPGAIRAEGANGRNIKLDEGENAYAEAVDKGHRIDPRAQKIFIMSIVLVVLYFVGLVMPQGLFDENAHNSLYSNGYTFSWFVEDLQSNINGLIAVFTGNDNGPTPFRFTMIRYIMVALTGAGMAISGAVYQGSFKNALVSPSTLGVMSGSSLGVVIWIVFFVNDDGSNVSWFSDSSYAETNTLDFLISNYSLSALCFLACLLVVGIILLTVKIAGKNSTSPIYLIITGQVIGGLMGALSNSVRYYYLTLDAYSAKSSLLTDLMIATFYRTYTWIDLVAVGVPLVLTFVVIMLLRRKMTMLQFTDAEARTMGVNTRRMQFAVVGLCTLLTAILISFVGSVGFVGFLVPHLARRLVGPNFSYLLPAALVLGAVFVLGAYVLLMTVLGAEYETMVGMFISIFGASVFLITALRGKGGVRGEFK